MVWIAADQFSPFWAEVYQRGNRTCGQNMQGLLGSNVRFP
jgi:hypothetical protein